MFYIPTTRESKLKVFKQCRDEFVYFVENYCVIKTEAKKKLFKLYDFQKAVASDFCRKEDLIILKGRQLGLSTLIAAFVAWRIIFYANQDICVISEKDAKAKALLRKIKLIYDNVPVFLRVEAKTCTTSELILVNDSRAVSEPRSPNAGRSETLTHLIIDEAAFIEDRISELIWESASPTLTTTNGKAIIISTPNGMGGWFYSMYDGAQTGDNDFIFLKIPWTVHPNRDNEWKDKEFRRLNSNPKKFGQEHECSFITSGDTVFDLSWLIPYAEETLADPIEKRKIKNWEGELWIWKRPEEGKLYMLGADPSRGDAGDFHAFHVLEQFTLDKVAEYRGKMPSTDFATLINEVAQEYNDCAVTVENNGVGWAVIQELVRVGKCKLVYTHSQRIIINPNKMQSVDDKRGTVPGLSMTHNTRTNALELLQKVINEGDYKIKSARELSELKTFIYKNGRPEAMDSTCHDDLIMALAQLLYVYEMYILSQQRAEQRLNVMGKLFSKNKDQRLNDVSSTSPQSVPMTEKRKQELIEKHFTMKIDDNTSLDIREFFNN